MMDWRTEAIDKLSQYEAKRQALESIPEQIAEIDKAMTAIRSARTDGIPVKGGGSGYEDRMMNLIVQKEELQCCLDCAQRWMRIVDRGLSVLDSEERKVLERLYIIRERGAVSRLADELGLMDERTVYKRRDIAIRKFTIALYGCVES